MAQAKRDLGLRKALKIVSKALLINMLNFVDCKIITIFEVDKAIKGNVVRGRNTRNSEDDSVARRVVVIRACLGVCTGSL